jgi:LPPG:FO 2-phospho-L-lactate transferase
LTIITVLAGGTGSIKLIRGLAAIEKDIAVICNVGDNIWIHSLYVCPDIDTIIYGLANILDQKRGWGIKGDSFQCLAQLKKIGAPAWFGLGDRDLATHLLRTSMMKEGKSLSEITNFFRDCYSLSAQIIPATDKEMMTRIVTNTQGEIHLQEFWVKDRGRPKVTGIRYESASTATANPAALDAIIALADLRNVLKQNRDKVIAISPLIGGKAVSGPAVKYMRALGIEASSFGVAKYYCDFASKFIISKEDHRMKLQIEALDMQVYETNITMKTKRDEVSLSRRLLRLVEK